jgi:hypothetical protein
MRCLSLGTRYPTLYPGELILDRVRALQRPGLRLSQRLPGKAFFGVMSSAARMTNPNYRTQTEQTVFCDMQ